MLLLLLSEGLADDLADDLAGEVAVVRATVAVDGVTGVTGLPALGEGVRTSIKGKDIKKLEAQYT